ncbi:MAG: prepilin-type N-terminal cleavage/methylation domain-containing protein [Thioalkalivibrionaceae bacterium]
MNDMKLTPPSDRGLVQRGGGQAGTARDDAIAVGADAAMDITVGLWRSDSAAKVDRAVKAVNSQAVMRSGEFQRQSTPGLDRDASRRGAQSLLWWTHFRSRSAVTGLGRLNAVHGSDQQALSLQSLRGDGRDALSRRASSAGGALRRSAARSTRFASDQVCGFALIEVLIAVLVFSVGLLAIAYTQQTSLRTSHAAFLHSLGSIAAADGVERLWVNACEADPANAVRADWQSHWSAGANAIPGWDASASTIQANGGRAYTVIVAWIDDRLGDDAARRVEYDIRLPAVDQLKGCET